MHEIGSEFWDVALLQNSNIHFPSSTQWYLSGRSALQAIINELKTVHTVAMPSWCCDSMVKPIADAGIEVHFYPVYFENGLVQELDKTCDALFLMDYFGYTTPAPELANYHGTVIRDVTHSIFSATYSDADYYFGSLRKWCGVWTGGYAWAADGHKLPVEENDDLGYTALRQRAMEQKTRYIKGLPDPKTGRITDKNYLETFAEAEEILDNIGIAPAASRDIESAKHLDVEKLKAARRKNARILMDAFSDWLIFPVLGENDCPMFVPVLVPDGKRNELRRFLIKQEIYCPVHWPVSDYHRLTDREKYIYDNELSLVCDQRYTEADMQRIVDTVKLFLGE